MKISKNGHKWLLLTASLILLATTLFWAVLSARLQNYNADQLVDGYLFESSKVFSHASFPGAHSFLLKWPLFALAAALGNTAQAVTILTVLCAVAIVGTVAGILAYIERRPAMLSLWFLALSSLLLLVPAQSAPGVLLPVNFAMLTTRNLEYVVFLVILILLTRTKSWRDRSALLAFILAVVLMASDGLFLPLLIGAVGFTWLLRTKQLRRCMVWLGIVLAGFIGAFVLTKTLQVFDITNFTNQGSVSPYKLGGGVSQLAQAGAYAVLGVATLFGANPAFAELSLSGLPHALVQSFHSVGIVGYVVNGLLLVLFAGLTLYFVKRFRKLRSRAAVFAALVLGAALASTAIYVLTDHYYPVDSRYLAVWFFALVFCSAVVLRTLELSKELVTMLAIGLCVALPFALFGSWQQYSHSQTAFKPQSEFQSAVAAQLIQYHIGTLVGDYWDVVPIRQAANNEPKIVPMADCFTPQKSLNSTAWQRSSGSVAYLINGEPYASGFKTCNPSDIEYHFGQPTYKVAITVPGKKQSWLYIYERGVKHASTHKTSVVAKPKPPTIPTPSGCSGGRVLQVVAHEDDDLLFMNPDLQYAVDADDCIMSVYITAGDAGSSEIYATGRMTGSQAAYTYIYNGSEHWSTKQVELANGTVTVATMENQPKLLQVFLNLPDGNVSGRGFTSRDHESLARLRSGAISEIKPIEGNGSYTASGLTDTLLAIMDAYKPTEVRTQNYNSNVYDGDHSDHHAAGYFATNAFTAYNANATLRSYAGYPVRALPKNVSGSILAAKEGAFFAYAGFDGAACASVVACYGSTAYGDYLPRQYSRLVAQNNYVAPVQPQPVAPPVVVAKKKPQATKPQPPLPLEQRRCTLGGDQYVIDCTIK